MKKFFHKIHLWLAIPFGVLITLVFLTGAMLVFEDDIVASAQAGGWVPLSDGTIRNLSSKA